MSDAAGTLFVVATPIGNRADVGQRALTVLAEVDCIAAEDTRHSRPLLSHYGIQGRLQALHEHNERKVIPQLLERLHRGEDIALIADAGTPLISDPGFLLVREARRQGLRVSPVPGPSAAIAALSVAGLPTDRFVFEGFLAPKSGARISRLQALASETRTLVFYESSHRIEACLQDMARCLGDARQAVVARELTKQFEQVQGGTLAALCEWIAADAYHSKGEFVVLVHGAAERDDGIDEEARRILLLMLTHLPVKTAAAVTAEITGCRKKDLYRLALELQ